MTDHRPDLKPRKNPRLWQAFLFWEEIMLMKQRHTLRISSIERGKSNLDGLFEQAMINGVVEMKNDKGKIKRYETFVVDDILESAKKIMINVGSEVTVWPWITGIRGLGTGGQAAKILALIDDIEKFDSVAKLWRYAGYGLYDYYESDGKVVAPKKGKKKDDDGNITEFYPDPDDGWRIGTHRDRGVKGFVLPYNKTLKSALHVMADLFIKAQTPVYVDLYYAEKKRQRELHPKPVNGQFTDGHLHNRAMRKMIKEFLKDLWLNWRTVEGLPVTEKYG